MKPDPDSPDSLDGLFDDVNGTSCSPPIEGDICPKEEPDARALANDDRRSSLLMMNFSLKEVSNAMAKLGDDAPINELVDFIFAAQIAENQALVPHQNDVGRNQESNTEKLFGTMDKTLRLLEMGFTEKQISTAIDKYGSEVPIAELADSICADELAGENKGSLTSSGRFCSVNRTSDRFRPWGADEKPSNSSFDPTIVKNEDGSSQPVTRHRDFDLERYKGKRPKEDYIDELSSFKRPKEEYDDDASSYVGPIPTWLGPTGGNPIPRRAVRKSMHMDELRMPNLGKSKSCWSVDRMAAKTPYFLYGNVLNLSQPCWAKISQFLYTIEPEFANTQFFSALSRKEGYIHNLPRVNRFHIHPKPPMTIEQAIPQTKRWWPSWDTRKQISCISTEVSGTSQLCDRLGRLLNDSRGLLSTEQQKEILHHCKTLNLLWVGHHKLAPVEPEHLERILGYPSNHTQASEYSLTERLHLLKHCFQIDSLGYYLSVLKPLFPKGVTILSIYSGIGGAEIALHRLSIHLKGVVAIEPCERKRKIIKKWWENSLQTGELVQIEDIQKLTTTKLESLITKFGGFDFIICQNPYTYSSKSPAIAADDDSLGALDFSLFYEFVRVLQRVRSAMERSS